ncbi:hypothetical protein D3C79_484480 [compost metagenome]
MRQCRGVVDAIADHCHAVALRLQLFDRLGLAVRQHAGDDLVDAGLFGNGVGGHRIVAGQHHQLIALTMQTLQCFNAVAAQRIADGDQRSRLPVGCQQHRRNTALGLLLHLRFQRCGCHLVLLQQRGVTQQQLHSVHFTADAGTAQGSELLNRRQRLPGGVLNDGTRQWVAGTLFQRGGPTQRLLLADLIEGDDLHHARLAFGQGSGFIKHQRIQGAGLLQRIGVAHQHAELGRAANAGNDRHRRRQAQRARAGDDQHRSGDHQRVNQLRLWAEEIPDRRAEQGDGHHHRHEHRRNAVRQFTNLRLAALRLAHQFDDARQRGFAADSAGAKQHAAVIHHRTGMHRIANAFLLRHGFAGQHGFVQPHFALHNFAVHRDTIAGGQAQRHAKLHLRQRNGFLAVVGHQPRRRRRQVQQPLQRL